VESKLEEIDSLRLLLTISDIRVSLEVALVLETPLDHSSQLHLFRRQPGVLSSGVYVSCWGQNPSDFILFHEQ
jgi:hypothetical protein